MRMRTIESSYEELRREDPNTELSKTAWRRLITTGILPSVLVGSKRLVDMDVVPEILARGTTPAPHQSQKTGEIRKIEV